MHTDCTPTQASGKVGKVAGKGLSFPGKTDRPGSVHYNPQVVRGRKEPIVNKTIIYFFIRDFMRRLATMICRVFVFMCLFRD